VRKDHRWTKRNDDEASINVNGVVVDSNECLTRWTRVDQAWIVWSFDDDAVCGAEVKGWGRRGG